MITALLWFAVFAVPATCGVERWPIKTVADSQADQIATEIKVATVEELRAELAPPDLKVIPDHRHKPVELTRYQVHALLLGYKQETDSDFHLVIASPSDQTVTMIAEIPAAKCVPAVIAKQESSLQMWLVKTFGRPRARGRMLKLHPPRKVIVEGVGFFDVLHGQTGVAPNGIEIHPVTAIRFDQGK